MALAFMGCRAPVADVMPDSSTIAVVDASDVDASMSEDTRPIDESPRAPVVESAPAKYAARGWAIQMPAGWARLMPPAEVVELSLEEPQKHLHVSLLVESAKGPIDAYVDAQIGFMEKLALTVTKGRTTVRGLPFATLRGLGAHQSIQWIYAGPKGQAHVWECGGKALRDEDWALCESILATLRRKR